MQRLTKPLLRWLTLHIRTLCKAGTQADASPNAHKQTYTHVHECIHMSRYICADCRSR